MTVSSLLLNHKFNLLLKIAANCLSKVFKFHTDCFQVQTPFGLPLRLLRGADTFPSHCFLGADTSPTQAVRASARVQTPIHLGCFESYSGADTLNALIACFRCRHHTCFFLHHTSSPYISSLTFRTQLHPPTFLSYVDIVINI